jgi:hypothetical protein
MEGFMFGWKAMSCLILAASISTLLQPLHALEPKVEAHFFSADAVQAVHKLRQFDAEDPGFNKMVFSLEGFPVNETVYMEVKRLSGINTEGFQPLLSFRVQEDGSYITSTNQRQKYLVASSRGFLPGERATYRFTVPSKGIVQEVKGIPNPLVFRDKEGHIALRAEIISYEPVVYAIDLPTMKEEEQYQLKTVTLGEIAKAKPVHSSKNQFHFSPSAAKSKGGVSTLEVRRKMGDVYFLKLPWGSALDPYLSEKDLKK